jgi:chemotaxis protein histidine kinase CheA
MRKRAERMGGKLIVNSLPGQGTRLIAALPLSMTVTDRFATESAEHLRSA